MKTTRIFTSFVATTALVVGSLGVNLTEPNSAIAGEYRGIYSIRSYNYPDHYMSHNNFLGYIEVPTTPTKKRDVSFRLRNGLANPNCTSFESINFPGYFLRHQNYRIKLHRNDGSQLFLEDATFCQRYGAAGRGISFESHNYPGYWIRHKNYELWINPSDNTELFRNDATFTLQRPLSYR